MQYFKDLIINIKIFYIIIKIDILLFFIINSSILNLLNHKKMYISIMIIKILFHIILLKCH